jgi:hypothetical protein
VLLQKSRRRFGRWSLMISSISFERCWKNLGGPADPDVERAWLAEAQRRSQELDSGVVEPIPAEEIFAKARTESNKTPRSAALNEAHAVR